MRRYLALLALPGARRFWAAGFLARFPGAMLAMAVTVLISGLYGEYRLAGVVTATLAIASAVGSPMVARLIDRYGQRRVGLPVLTMTVVSAIALTALATARVSAWALVIAAALMGAAGLQFGTLVRARWSRLLGDYARVHTAFSLEAVVDDLCFVIGPSVATAIGTALWPGSAMTLVVALLVIGGLVFFAQRDTEPSPAGRTPGKRGGATLAAAPIAVAFVAVGVGFGANGITMVAMCESLGAKWASGLILGFGSLASMVGALTYGARYWRPPLWARYAAGLLIMAGASALFLLAHSLPALAAVAFAAGIAISPTFINGNDMIQRLVPPESLTEGLTWIGTALGVGLAFGSTAAGMMVDAHGAHAGYWVMGFSAAAMAVLALVTAPILRAKSLAVR